MKIRIIKIGKPALKGYKELAGEYQKRIAKVAKFEFIELKAENGREKNAAALSNALAQNSANSGKHIIVCLDEDGENWSSEDLAKKISNWRDNPGIQSVSFLIGGPYGINEEILAKADAVWSLSKAVFPSDLAWLATTEQIYRAHSIISGSGYHHA